MRLLALVLVFVFFVANISVALTAPGVKYDQQQSGDVNIRIDLKDIEIVALLDSGLGDFGDYDISNYDYTDFTIKPSTSRPTSSNPGGSTPSSTTSVKPWNTWPTISTSASPTSTSATSSTVLTEQEKEKDDEKKGEEDQVIPSSNPESESIDKTDDNESEENVNSAVIAELLSSAVAEGIPIKINPSDEKPSDLSDSQGTQETHVHLESDKKDPADSQTSSSEENAKKCIPGYTRDQKGQCRRLHARRRIPSSLLPFGIRLAPRIHRHRDNQ